MPLVVSEVGEITENIAIWRNNPTVLSAFSIERDISSAQWVAGSAIDVEGAKSVQVMFWAQKSGDVIEDLDIAVYAKSQTAGATNLFACSVFRIIFGRAEELVRVALGSRPINDAAIDNTAAWRGCSRIDPHRPREGRYPFALSPIAFRVYQERSLMAMVELVTIGFTTLMMEVKAGGLATPTRSLALYKLR